MFNIPPRHGKSRTLILFTSWVLGKENSKKVITGSYNDTLAQDFSKFTRNTISEQKNDSNEIVFSDIFPDVNIKHGSSSYQRWALEGYHFNYLGAGVGGTMTGKGCDIGIIDDPIKSSKEAYNIGLLDDIWDWFCNTFLSRLEENGKIIINMTRWAKADLCGRLLGEYKKTGEKEVAEPEKWYILKMEAVDPDGNMLCPELLSRESYEDKKALMDKAIHSANYHQKALDSKGLLYKNIKTYDIIPLDKNGQPDFDFVCAYCDTADEGTDYLCNVIAGVKRMGDMIYRYALDIYYTDEKMEITEPELARRYHKIWKDYGFPIEAVIESNNGGRSFARKVESIVNRRYDSRAAKIRWKHQTENKKARILSNASDVVNWLFYPRDWDMKFTNYYDSMTTYKRRGGNSYDDAQDATTGLIEISDVNRNKITAGAKL